MRQVRIVPAVPRINVRDLDLKPGAPVWQHLTDASVAVAVAGSVAHITGPHGAHGLEVYKSRWGNRGGYCPWFICPKCCRVAKFIYSCPEGWACRKCLKIPKQGQYLSKFDKLVRRRAAIRRELKLTMGLYENLSAQLVETERELAERLTTGRYRR